MRIVSGQYRGRSLISPEGSATRPTSDRAREAAFNVLAHAPWAGPIAGARVLDLFAGSGALGLEAMSRGAAFALFVETDDAARGAIRQNVETLGLFGVTRIHRRSAVELGPRPGPLQDAFDLIFLDPPYGKGLGEAALAGLRAGGWVAPGAIVMLERGASDPDGDTPGFELLDERTYGAARVTFLRAE
jgi:16S rRNA (guanine966-N2)-methyltransferase